MTLLVILNLALIAFVILREASLYQLASRLRAELAAVRAETDKLKAAGERLERMGADVERTATLVQGKFHECAAYLRGYADQIVAATEKFYGRAN